jgi:hypothetical protein
VFSFTPASTTGLPGITEIDHIIPATMVPSDLSAV